MNIYNSYIYSSGSIRSLNGSSSSSSSSSSSDVLSNAIKPSN